MREWRDNQGRPWQLALTVLSARRVRDTVKATYQRTGADGQPTGETEERRLDLLDTASIGQTLSILRGNFLALSEALLAIHEPQVAAKGLDGDQFLDGLAGDALDAARSALEDELVAFFPRRYREVVAEMSRRMTEVETELTARAREAIATAVAGPPGMLFGSALESSASTRESGPSVSL